VATQSQGPVALHIPAASAYLALARAATAAVCARLDFPVDLLEDTALAVDEAASLLLQDAVAGSELTCSWTPDGDDLLIQVTSESQSGRTPRETTFAWTVLTALVNGVTADLADNRVTLSLTVSKAGAHTS
jgi:serine/threonine-protein kinase RsbW